MYKEKEAKSFQRGIHILNLILCVPEKYKFAKSFPRSIFLPNRHYKTVAGM